MCDLSFIAFFFSSTIVHIESIAIILHYFESIGTKGKNLAFTQHFLIIRLSGKYYYPHPFILLLPRKEEKKKPQQYIQ